MTNIIYFPREFGNKSHAASRVTSTRGGYHEEVTPTFQDFRRMCGPQKPPSVIPQILIGIAVGVGLGLIAILAVMI